MLYAGDGNFWSYQTTHWQILQESLLKQKILEVIDSSALVRRGSKVSLINNVVELLLAKQAKSDDVLRFADEPLPVINCTNGELWIEADGSVELRSHDPKSFQRHILDVVYDANARCPLYSKTLHEIFSNSTTPNAMVRYWHELTGYIIQPNRSIPIIAILFGGGSNGKTKLMETISRLLGSKQVMATKIGDLDKNRFLVGSLLGKFLVLDDDVQAGTCIPDGELKKLSEAKKLTGENKYGPPFEFICRAVPIMSCNNMISLGDISYGMRRRLMIIPFD